MLTLSVAVNRGHITRSMPTTDWSLFGLEKEFIMIQMHRGTVQDSPPVSST